jgi:hypothetical protein
LPKQSLNKSITAKKLHRRTMNPLSEPEVTIPFGAILEKLQVKGDSVTFEYLTEPYGCKRDMMQGAITLPQGTEPEEETASSAGTASVAAAPASEPVKLRFEALSSNIRLSRAKVPGGWLLTTTQGGIGFYPDARHEWTGESLHE